MKLTVAIITLNEEKDLPRCLNSIRQLADEIVVVDCGSTDKTVEIARKFGVKVYSRKFDDYANQKNYALQLARGEWILSLDADEEISVDLAQEIKKVIKSDKFVAYAIPRENIILGKWIKHTRWQSELDRHIWLWKKNAGKWEGRVHEEVIVKGKVGILKNLKVHYQYGTVKEFLEMINNYSDLETKDKFSYSRLFFDPIYNFCVRYFYRLGVLDGWRGFVLSYLMGVYHLVTWVKVWVRSK